MKVWWVFVLYFSVSVCGGQEIPAVEVIPLSRHQASFQNIGQELVRWHYGDEYPRPFLYPLKGPKGGNLTRMGHPGAANHDHHRSVWFAHHKVNGLDFWADGKGNQIRQKQWISYQDGESESIMATLLGWYDEQGDEHMEQEAIIVFTPSDDNSGEYSLEFQLTFRPPGKKESVNLEKTNFGFLAVRVAKSVSEFFGGGTLTNSEGQLNEKKIFGKPAKWMDYSGPVATGKGDARKVYQAGITYFDHPENPRYPTSWHVRQDGWMGASFCMHEGLEITKDAPLVLRYLLYIHEGQYDAEKATSVAEAFSKRVGLQVVERPRPHTGAEVQRVK